MSRKSFWNWLGLPSFADIQELQESARRQEEAFASLAKVNAEASRALASIQADLSDSVDRVNSTNQNMLEAVEKMICETIQAGIDSSRHSISEQMSDLAHDVLSQIQSELGISSEQVNHANQEVAAGVEKRIRETVQACTEKSEQLISSHTRMLTEQALATAKVELEAAMKQSGEKNRGAVDAAEERICAAIRTYTKGSQQILSEQANKVAEGIAALSTCCDTVYGLDKDSQERIEHIITECRAQNELLRMLLANTLIDDVSQKFSTRKVSTGPTRRNR